MLLDSSFNLSFSDSFHVNCSDEFDAINLFLFLFNELKLFAKYHAK